VSPDGARPAPSVTSNTATAAPAVVSTGKSSAAPASDQIKQQLGEQCWVSKIDKKSGKRYYFTAAEKRPQWEAPAGWDPKIPDDAGWVQRVEDSSTTKSAGGSTTSAPKSGGDSTTTKSGAGSTTTVPKSAKSDGDSTTAESKSGGDGTTTAAAMAKSGGGSTATSNTSNQGGGDNTAATDESAKTSPTKKVPMSSPHGSAPVSSPTTKPPRPSAKKPGNGS